MNSIFQLYTTLGFQHITDLNAYDHILFIVALTITYNVIEWKKLAILVTAFTIGHSLTLILTVLDIIHPPVALIEQLILISILLTCIYNLIWIWKSLSNKISTTTHYLIALSFGLIHGMGFSSYLKAMLMPGEEDQLILQLFSFNVGIELGQLIIVAILLFLSYIVIRVLGVRRSYWVSLVSLVVFVWVLWLFFS